MRRKELLNRLETDKEFKKIWEWVCEQNNDVVADKILKLQSQITDLKKQNKIKKQKENIDIKNNNKEKKEEIKVVDVSQKVKSTPSNKKKKTIKSNITTKTNKGVIKQR